LTHGEKVAAQTHDLIPFTGLDVGLLIVTALILIAIGLIVRWAVKRPGSTVDGATAS
jgi:hypothetical protein